MSDDNQPATKSDIRSAIAKVRREMATKKELGELEQRVDTKLEAVLRLIKEDGEETRRHFDVTVETIRSELTGASDDAASLLKNQVPDHEDRISDLEKHVGLPAGPRFKHLGQ